MSRIAEGAVLAALDALEPEAKDAWESEECNLSEAVALSNAITQRRLADAQEASKVAAADSVTVTIAQLDPAVVDTLPTPLRDRYQLEN